LTLFDRGDPRTLPIKEEIPLFFFHGVEFFLASSEYLFDDETETESVSGGVALTVRSPIEKLADWRKDGLIIFEFGLVYDSGGGAGRRREFWYPEAFVLSRVLRVPGCALNSSEVFSSKDWREG